MNAPDHHPIDLRLPELLRSGRPLRGVFNGLPSPAIVEMCAYAGFDFILLDNEHGSAGLECTEHLLRAARASGIPAIVRCLEHDMARTLDLGASAVQIPMVETAAHARALVQRIKYPTRGLPGQRGAAFSTRAAGYGAFGGTGHTQRSNDGVALIVMIETELGVANAAEIAAVEGVDAVFVGPNDLAHSMGVDNRWNEPAVQAAIESALRAIDAAGACPGILALTVEEEARYATWGARYFASNTAGILMAALREAATRGR